MATTSATSFRALPTGGGAPRRVGRLSAPPQLPPLLALAGSVLLYFSFSPGNDSASDRLDLRTLSVSLVTSDSDAAGSKPYRRPDGVILDEGACLPAAKHATLHDSRLEYVETYERRNDDLVESWPMTDREYPEVARFSRDGEEAWYAPPPLWRPTAVRCGQSAWRKSATAPTANGTGTDFFFSSDRDPCWVSPSSNALARAASDPGTPLPSWINVVRVRDVEVCAYTSWFPDNFGHVIHDHLPNIAYLREVLPPSTKIALQRTPVYESIIQFLDPKFERERVVWLDAAKGVQSVLSVTGSRGGLSVVVNDRRPPINMGAKLWGHFRRWMMDTPHGGEWTPPGPDKKVVYYSRGRRGVMHGRVVEPQHEADIVALIRRKMDEYRRPEELVVFTGQDSETGRPLSVEEQFRLFRSASAVIGPHGSGMANVVWTFPMHPSADPAGDRQDASTRHDEACSDRLSVIEFTPGLDSDAVKPGGAFTHHYYPQFRGLPLDYHHVLYAPNSTIGKTFVRLDEVGRALDAAWGGEAGGKKEGVVTSELGASAAAA